MFSGGTSTNNFKVQLYSSPEGDEVNVENLTPNIISFNQSTKEVSRITDGLAKLRIYNSFWSRTYERFMFKQSTEPSLRTFKGYSQGSLAKYLFDQFIGFTDDLSIAPSFENMRMFSSNNLNPNSPEVVRNPNIYTGSLDLTFLSVMNGNSTTHQAMPISKRHILTSQHSPTSGKVVWKDSSGSYFSCNIVRGQSVNSGSGPTVYEDLRILYLDQDIPSNIPLMKFLPSDYKRYLPMTQGAPGVPFFVKNSRSSTLWQDTLEVMWSNRISSKTLYLSREPYSGWNTPIIGGDSGSPVFIHIEGSPVVITPMAHTAGGPMASDFLSEISTVMNATKDGADETVYAPILINLSAFATFN